MSDLISSKRVQKVSSILTVTLAFCALSMGQAHAKDKVTTYKDENGWQLRVNGEPYYVNGVVWGYSPRNQNYSYGLWGESDDFIRKVLDYDFGLMAAAGVNANRSFTQIPPKWVTYIYREHGIRSVINPLMGRYGYSVGGKWIPFTDYSDPLTRETLKKDMLAIFDKYKDVEGVLMYALGNESNYGLSWSSFEIENLPEGEQNTAKARYLYSLYEEIMSEAKKIAPDIPQSIVNGDIQYIDLIAELCPSLDVLGSNVYRGPSFTNLWSEVDKKLDLPVVFYEFGSDAFNARAFREDQLAQATILRDQWREMYNKAYGNGEEGNAIGGFVFEWRDEWWKYLQVENLDVQDNNASWSNEAYQFDWAPGKNNMNEEWFGIAALGDTNADGVYTARPRMAYDVLSEIWHMDPYADNKTAFNQAIDNINMDLLEVKGDVRQLKSESDEKKKVLHFTGGTFRAEYLVKGTETEIDEDGENGLAFSPGEMMFLDFGFQPAENLEGQFTLNILGDVAQKEPLEIAYGRRGLSVEVVTVDTLPRGDPDADPNDPVIFAPELTTEDFNDRERIEFYDFEATYRADQFDLTTFYHTPRYHWGYEGDFYGLMWEATDLAGMDIWNAKAPEGVEIEGTDGWMKGLKVVAGPEIYWGANPKIMLKYENKLGKRTDYAVIYSEDVARRDEGTGATGATDRQGSAFTLYTKTKITDKMTLELGAIMGNEEREDETYTRLETNAPGGRAIVRDEIELEDTLGVKGKFSFPLLGQLGYVGGSYSGLVADGGNPLRELGTRLPYTGLGANWTAEAGLQMNFGYWMVFPRILYREALTDPNPSIEADIFPCPDPDEPGCPPGFVGDIVDPGLGPRNRDDDPFAILDNRDTRAAELFITYDPTGATPFYDWDNDMREDAKFAFNLGLNYTEYPTFTDSYQFFFEPTSENAAFGVGLPPEDVWEASTRMVFNPNNKAKYIFNLHAGRIQSTGDPEGGSREFQTLTGKAIINKRHIFEGYFRRNAFGPYDFQRQFNIIFPEQFKLDYSILLDSKRDEGRSTKIGVKTLYRSYDENDEKNQLLFRQNGDWQFQTVFYFLYNFGGTPPPDPRD